MMRWPKLCLRCGSLDHYSEDCTRMPTQMGMCDQERDIMATVRRDRNSILFAVAAIFLAMVITGILQW